MQLGGDLSRVEFGRLNIYCILSGIARPVIFLVLCSLLVSPPKHQQLRWLQLAPPEKLENLRI